MNETKTENLLAGSTDEAPAGAKSLPSMKHGEESPAMLLALLNSPLATMLATKQAQILGHFANNGRVGTIIIVYGAKPTESGMLKAEQ